MTEFYMKRVFDNPVIYVRDGSMDRAVKSLKARVQRLGVYAALKERELYPARCDRLRAKAEKARMRLRRLRKKGVIK